MALTSILGGIFGMAGSFVPAILDVYNKKQERKHDLEVKKIEADLAKTGHEFALKGKNVDADTAETTALLAHDTAAIAASSTSWIAMLSASVRPVITYCFFLMFFIVKMSALWQAWYVQDIPVTDALWVIWDENTAALFAAILGFWFGSRAMTKFGYGRSQPTRTPPIQVK